jgi:uncharacterized protein YdhG (YjbR/CyaY superfamily)
MRASSSIPESVDTYIASFPESVRERLIEMRRIIRSELPEATEKISYRMPTFVLGVNAVYFAAFKRHIGFYPTSGPIEHFTESLAGYAFSKGAVQFPFDKPLPEALIREMVRYRRAEIAKDNRGA